MDLHKKKKEYNKKEMKELAPPAGSTTNNVFIGSTTDLQRMLQDMNKVKENDIIDITATDDKS
jgi:hypothetical protein